jgi:dTDP-4-dehydrorhamnose 3,5-epimerase-like enzyme
VLNTTQFSTQYISIADVHISIADLHLSTLKVCVENFQNLEKWMSYAFSICDVDNLRHQNGVLWAQNRINYAWPKVTT